MSFILENKQYKYFPDTTKILDEVNRALPKLVPPSSTTLEIATVPPPTFIQPPVYVPMYVSMYYKLSTLVFASTPSIAQLTKLLLKI